jgi:NADP-dependent 3-hydroxy acid dehydrogenase YdfG
MYVITGATGNTGSVIANELLEKGQPVRVIGRNESRLQPFADKGAEPFVAELVDQAGLRRAFSGARAVYAMIPPDMSQPDISAYQSLISEAIAGALEQAAVKYVVSLSSIGADKPDGTGPVVGLHRFEQRLNRIPGLNVLHLRAGGEHTGSNRPGSGPRHRRRTARPRSENSHDRNRRYRRGCRQCPARAGIHRPADA